MADLNYSILEELRKITLLLGELVDTDTEGMEMQELDSATMIEGDSTDV